MMSKNYQRRYQRAPFKESFIYADGDYVLIASTLNISRGGILIDQLPSFPGTDEVPLMFSLPELPSFKNFSILKMQAYSPELLKRQVIRAKVRIARREQLSQNLDNIFRSQFGVEFVRISENDQKLLDEYVSTFAANLIYLQTLIDSFNSDEETKIKVRVLASILGYKKMDRISDLHAAVSLDYQSLQWL
jgi:hypothetical protein